MAIDKSKAYYSADSCMTDNFFNGNKFLAQKLNIDPLADLAYKKAVSSYILQCGPDGSAPAMWKILDWLSGPSIESKATEFYQRVMQAPDHNIVVANANDSDGQYRVDVTIAPVDHYDSGTKSPLSYTTEFYHYASGTMLSVVPTTINTATAWAHKAKLISRTAKAFSIKQGERLLVLPGYRSGKNKCAFAPASHLRDDGFIKKVNPMRIVEDWCVYKGNAMFGEEEVYQFPLITPDGKETTSWMFAQKWTARYNLMMKKVVEFLLGSKVTNPNDPMYGSEFVGFDGYVTQLMTGGGNYQPISMAGIKEYHFDMVERNAIQYNGIKEFVWAMPWEQRKNLRTNYLNIIGNNPGSCTFETFKKTGDHSQAAVSMLGISSIERNGFTHHFMTLDFSSMEKGIGNDYLANAIFVMPSYGLKDIKGNPVPTFEYIKPIGTDGIDYTVIETDDLNEMNRVPFCEKVSGTMSEVLQLKINCLDQHWMFQPDQAV